MLRRPILFAVFSQPRPLAAGSAGRLANAPKSGAWKAREKSARIPGRLFGVRLNKRPESPSTRLFLIFTPDLRDQIIQGTVSSGMQRRAAEKLKRQDPQAYQTAMDAARRANIYSHRQYNVANRTTHAELTARGGRIGLGTLFGRLWRWTGGPVRHGHGSTGRTFGERKS